MRLKFRILRLGILLIAFLRCAAQTPSPSASLHGIVLDPSGAVIADAQVSLIAPHRAPQTTLAGADGRYSFNNLRPGTYSIEARAKGFDVFRLDRVVLAQGEEKQLDLNLSIAVQKEEVTVSGQNEQVGVGAVQNANATIIRGSAHNALSDDPNVLQSELQTLAGPAAGPNGGEIYIDGFAGGKIPPKSSILSVSRQPWIRFLQRTTALADGRVEIITKPGSQKFGGSISAGGNPSAVNTANPLVSNQPSYYQYTISGDVSGPISKKAAYYFNGFRMIFQNQNMVDALNPNDLTTNIREAVPAPVDTLSVNPRIDVQLSANNTLTLRDSFYRTSLTGQDVGTLDFASQAASILSEENALQVGETYLVNAHFVNETHFQWSHIINNQEARRA